MKKEYDVIGKGRNRKEPGGGMGRGGGQGQRPGQRAGRMGGPEAAGPIGYCVCPQCGQKIAHERGIPCNQSLCPKCDVPMIRE